MSATELPPAPSPAYRVTGPTAASQDLGRAWHLASTLAVTDWKVRFFGSVLGYVWSLLRPLLLFGILYFVFAIVLDAGGGVADYGVVLLLGMILFFYFTEVTGAAVTSIVDREALVRKIGFPRVVVPLAVTLAATFNLLLNLVVLVVFIAISGVEPRWTWLALPIPFVLLAIGAAGLGMLLSALYVPFRDVRPIWEVIAQALFYATPVLYPVQALINHSETVARIALLNPLAALIQEARHLLLGPGQPSPAEVLGGTAWLLIPSGILVGLTVLGVVVFQRLAPGAADQL